MSVIPRIAISTIVQHPSDRSFAMIAKRDEQEYLMIYNNGFHSANAYLLDGTTNILFRHAGFGSYHLTSTSRTPVDVSIDPLCEAITARGWHQNHLWMFLPGSLDGDVISCDAHRKDKLLPQELAWTDSTKPYVIVPEIQTGRRWTSERCPWLILVNLADNGHFHIRAEVPRVYEPEALASLLKAIETIPHSLSVKSPHPASLAPGLLHPSRVPVAPVA